MPPAPPPTAANSVELVRATGSSLAGVNEKFSEGVSVVLGTPADGTRELVRLVAGLDRPRAGSVRVAGLDPFRTPGVRARVGAVLDVEDVPPAARSVHELLSLLLSLRGAKGRASELLEEYDLKAWASRHPRSLSGEERRTLAMIDAFGIPSPIAIVVMEPFVSLPGLSKDRVSRELKARAAAGAVVLCAVSSARDAAELSEVVSMLHLGRLLPATLAAAPTLSWALRTERPRELAAVLSSDPAVYAVQYDASFSPQEVFVRGHDSERVALAISKAAASHGLSITAIEPQTVPVSRAPRAPGDLTQLERRNS